MLLPAVLYHLYITECYYIKNKVCAHVCVWTHIPAYVCADYFSDLFARSQKRKDSSKLPG